MKKIFASELKAGDSVDDVFVLGEKNIARKKDGGDFITISLSDKTGMLKGVVWDNIDTLRQSPVSGDYVHVTGMVSEYRGSLQVVVRSMEACLPEKVNPFDFIASTSRNPDVMLDKLKEISYSLEDRYLSDLVKSFLEDKEFAEKFKTAPAGKRMHHAYLGGLLEHTLSVALLADRVAGHYSGIDRDLLLTGAILHDIGKVKEFVYERRIEYSDEGRLVSHIVLGVEMIREKAGLIEGFPEKTSMLLKHMVVSHHGNREFGSPEPPKTLEAVLLNYLDEIDSKINGIRNFMDKQDTDEDWTTFHRLLERHFYRAGSAAARQEEYKD